MPSTRDAAFALAVRERTRRHFFRDCVASGWGRWPWRSSRAASGGSPMAELIAGHHGLRRRASHRQKAAARSPPIPGISLRVPGGVIYLFMAGGPSQLELFDYKPELPEV